MALTRSKRVLIVEDELMIRMLLEDMLAELGYRLCRARAARALPQPAAAEEAFSDR
jgi:CheY-like chemotaxis protein